MISPQQLISHIPAYVLEVITILETNGHQAWLVGGCVRDLLQGAVPQDYDIATDARPDQVTRLFDHHIMTGYRHGTVTVLINRHPVEVTTFRSESEYSDGRRPDQVVFHSDIQTDLLRRDFTINSMAWHPQRGLFDPAQGQQDLGRRVLRCVGDPDLRFSEDGLRLLRALRFCAALDLTATDDTVAAAGRQAWRINQLSRERVWSELRKSMTSRYPVRMIPFARTGVLETAVQGLFGPLRSRRSLTEPIAALSRPDRTEAELVALLLILTCAAPDQDGTIRDVDIREWSDGRTLSDWRKRLVSEGRLARKVSEDALLILYWLGLLVITSVDQAATAETARRQLAGLLRLLHRRGTNRSRSALRSLIEQAAGICDQLELIPDAGPRNAQALQLIDRIPLAVTDLAIRGNDLLAAGFRQGPELQTVLERLLSHALRQPGPVTRADLLRLAGRIAGKRPSDLSGNDNNLSHSL